MGSLVSTFSGESERSENKGIKIEPVLGRGNGRDDKGVLGLRDGEVTGEDQTQRNRASAGGDGHGAGANTLGEEWLLMYIQLMRIQVMEEDDISRQE
ncbi:hypothetical protein Pfo_007914 [Paulownia fortunei]|nr:hypothetical protein Pfo_007914 [Paulownia fortunei]